MRRLRCLKLALGAMVLAIGLFQGGRLCAEDAVTLQLRWRHGSQFAGYYVAKEEGYYAAEGLDVRLSEGGAGIDVCTEVLEGRAQFGVGGSEAILRYLQGQPVRSVAVVVQHSPYALMVRRGTGIEHPQHLIGRTVYLGDLRRNAEIQAMLRHEGVSLDAMDLVDYATLERDFRNPSIDAFSVYLTNEPHLADEMGMAFDLIRPISYGIDFYGDGLITSQTEIDRHGERVRRFVRASLRGWRDAFEHPQQTIDLVMEHYDSEGRDRAHLEFELTRMRELTLPDLVELGTQNPQRWDRVAKTYADLGMAPPTASAQGYVFDESLEAAAAQQRVQQVLLWSVGVAAAVLLLGVVWTRGLRARVRKRTEELSHEVAGHEATRRELERTLSSYRTLFTSFPLGLTVTDPNGSIVEANAMAESILGVAREVQEARTIDSDDWQLIRSDGSSYPAKEFPSVVALNERRTVAGELMGFAKPDGSVTWLEVTASPIPVDDLGVVVAYRDVTREHLARENMARLQEVLEHSEAMAHVGSWHWEVATDTVTWSRELFKILDRDPALGAPSWAEHPALYVPEDFGRLTKLVEHALETAEDYSVELRAIRGDGSIRSCVARGFPEADSHGRVVGLSGILMDVTELVEALEEARMLSRDQATILDNIRALLIYKDTRNNILRVTESVAQATGMPRDQIEGRPSVEIYPDMAEQYYADDLEVIESGTPKLGIIEPLPVAGGETRWLITDKIPTFDAQGAVTGIIVSAVDITELKHMEAQLVQSQKLEAVGVLAGGIAHDFNNMLCAITGYTELALAATPRESVVHQHLEQVMVAATRASKTVEQILTFARRADGVRQVVRISDVVEEVIALLGNILPSSIVVTHHVEPGIPPVNCDTTQIQQVLVNLCTNARDAMPGGGDLQLMVERHVVDAEEADCHQNVDAGDFVHLQVRDTGDGITPQHLERIFEPFFSTKEEGKGTGMGLAASYGIVVSHGGFMRAESEPGVGSTFHVLLPAASGEVEEFELHDETEIEPGQGVVLVLDDERTMLEMLSEVLRSSGYVATPYSTGSQALAAITADPQRWDVVLTDQTMPEVSGVEILNTVRELRPDLPVVIMTGHSESLSAEPDGGVGADAVIMKPFRTRELLQTLRTVLDRER
jgi:PAS domain S-box-containing protein